jgi:hypothetical protein
VKKKTGLDAMAQR